MSNSKLLFCSVRMVQFSSVQSLSHVQLFVAPWTAARQASLSITSSQSLLRLMSIESVMPSNHLILCYPLLLLPSIGIPSLPWLAAAWTYPLRLREGDGSWYLFPTNKKWGTQKGFHVQKPHLDLLGFKTRHGFWKASDDVSKDKLQVKHRICSKRIKGTKLQDCGLPSYTLWVKQVQK